jgi:hypothetical protein
LKNPGQTQKRDYGGLRHPDIVSIEVLPNTGPAVRIFNVYNRNTLRSVNLLDELQHAEHWIVAGDMNAHPHVGAGPTANQAKTGNMSYQ